MPGTSVPSVAVCAITSDTNGNLWVAEPALNRIAKITTAGAITQYPVRTSNAWVTAITNSDGEPLTAAFSGAVWFTEAVGNKVGRITSSGSVTEYSIPTASALPSGIAPCPTTVCGANGGVWFAENATGKIGRYDF
jgi:virginiamycin B lyase